MEKTRLLFGAVLALLLIACAPQGPKEADVAAAINDQLRMAGLTGLVEVASVGIREVEKDGAAYRLKLDYALLFHAPARQMYERLSDREGGYFGQMFVATLQSQYDPWQKGETRLVRGLEVPLIFDGRSWSAAYVSQSD